MILEETDYNRDIKTGDIIKTPENKYYLVGAINRLGGICDDCREINIWEVKNEVIGNVFDTPEFLKQLEKELQND